jgi:hypothetical protein
MAPEAELEFYDRFLGLGKIRPLQLLKGPEQLIQPVVVQLIEPAKHLLLTHRAPPDSPTTECSRGHPPGLSSIVYRVSLVHLVSLVYLDYLV